MTDEQADCYGDGTVYRGERSRDSQIKTVWVSGLPLKYGTPSNTAQNSVSDNVPVSMPLQ